MVDLGQKRRKRFRLFYFILEKEIRVKNTDVPHSSNHITKNKKRRTANFLAFRLFFFTLFFILYSSRIKIKKIDKKNRRITLSHPSILYILYSIFSKKDYLSKAYLLATSVQLITLKKASI